MRVKILPVACIAVLFLAGCSNIHQLDLPKNPATGNPSVSSIIDRLRCELAYLVSDQYPYSSFVRAARLVVGAQLDLSVTDEGSLAPNLTWIESPMLSVNFGVRYGVSRQQNFTERLYFSLEEIYAETKGKLPRLDPNNPEAYSCPKIDTYLAGELGIPQTVEMASLSNGLDLYSTKLQAASGAFGGYVNFIVTRNANMIGPTWMLRHFRGPGSLAGYEEKNNHKITIAFASASATGQTPTIRVDAFLDRLIQGQIVNQLANVRFSPL